MDLSGAPPAVVAASIARIGGGAAAPMGTEIVIQILRGDAAKQTKECLRYADSQGWHIRTMVPPGLAGQTVQLVRDGQVSLVLMPFVSGESLAIEAEIREAGGEVAYCRQSPVRQASIDTSGLIIAVYEHTGRSMSEIADFLRVSAERVARTLGRRSNHPGR